MPGTPALRQAREGNVVLDAHLVCQAVAIPTLGHQGNTRGQAVRHGRPGQVDAAKRRLWMDHFGPDWWVSDHAGWRLVGLNAMLFDSGLPEEAEQWAWLDTVLEARAGRDVLLFVHKPLYLDDPGTTADSTLFYAAGTRRRLMDLALRHAVRAIGSGHLHRRFVDAHHGVQLVWAPSSGFVMGGFPPRLPVGETEVGYVEYRLGDGVLSHHFIRPPAFALNDMSETMARLKSTVNLPPKPWLG